MKKIHKIFHTSWLIGWVSFGFLLGVLGSLKFSGFLGIEWIIVSACLIILSFINKSYLGVVLALFGGLTFGLWRGGNELFSQAGWEKYYGQNVVVIGKVAQDPSIDTDGRTRLRLKEVNLNERAMGGEVWVGIDKAEIVKRSDLVEIEGQLTKGFGTIPAAIYRGNLIAVERHKYEDIGRDVRDWFAGGIREGIQEPEASLGAGFLLGQKTALPESLENELVLLGLTHIVVASGYNLTILIRFSRRFLFRISRFTALAGSIGLVYFFLQMTGFSPSMSRASLIAFLSLMAWYFGRKIHPVVLILFSAFLTILINPTYIWGDIGWLLSFGSFIGVIILSPLINCYFWGDKKPGSIKQVFIETMCAQLLTLPLIAYVFGQYSPISVIANALVLPFIPLAMALTAIAGLSALVLPFSAQIIAFPAEPLLRYMTFVINRLAQLPIASVEMSFSMTTLLTSYLAIFSVTMYMWRRTNYPFREYNVIE